MPNVGVKLPIGVSWSELSHRSHQPHSLLSKTHYQPYVSAPVSLNMSIIVIHG